MALLPAALFGYSVATLITAYGFEHLGGLEPCILCVYERTPWMAAIALSGLALFFRHRPQRALHLALAAVLLAGGALALYHVGVEQKIVEGPAVCDPGIGAVESIEELREKLEGRPIVRCDEPAWIFLGLSMAAWNGVLSGLGALAAFGAALQPNRRRGRA